MLYCLCATKLCEEGKKKDAFMCGSLHNLLCSDTSLIDYQVLHHFFKSQQGTCFDNEYINNNNNLMMYLFRLLHFDFLFWGSGKKFTNSKTIHSKYVLPNMPHRVCTGKEKCICNHCSLQFMFPWLYSFLHRCHCADFHLHSYKWHYQHFCVQEATLTYCDRFLCLPQTAVKF